MTRTRSLIAKGQAIATNPDHRSVLLGFVDQTFSSATNFGLSLIAGRLLGPSGLGEVFLGFSIYLVGLGLQRRLLTEPLVAATAGADASRRSETAGQALSFAIATGLAASLLALMAGFVIPGLPGKGILLIAPWLLPTLLQDVIRNIFFRDRRASAAAANDGVWLVAMALCVIPAWRIGTPQAAMACWGIGAVVATLVGLLQLKVRPRSVIGSIRWWRADALPFGKWNAGAAIVSQIGSHAGVFVLSIILGAAALGGLRAAESIFAPLTLVVPAIALPGLPLVARAVGEDPRRALRISIGLSLVAFGATLAYVTMIALGGWRLLPVLFGESFAPYKPLIWPIGTAQLLTSAGVGLLLFMKGQRRGRELLVNRAIAAILALGAVIFLAMRYGITGAAWGNAVGSLISLLLLAYATIWRTGTRRFHPEQPPALAGNGSAEPGPV